MDEVERTYRQALQQYRDATYQLTFAKYHLMQAYYKARYPDLLVDARIRNITIDSIFPTENAEHAMFLRNGFEAYVKELEEGK